MTNTDNDSSYNSHYKGRFKVKTVLDSNTIRGLYSCSDHQLRTLFNFGPNVELRALLCWTSDPVQLGTTFTLGPPTIELRTCSCSDHIHVGTNNFSGVFLYSGRPKSVIPKSFTFLGNVMSTKKCYIFPKNKMNVTCRPKSVTNFIKKLILLVKSVQRNARQRLLRLL